MTDHVDQVVAQWASVRPDLDCSSMAVVGRLRNTSHDWDAQLSCVFNAHGLSMIEFDIMATLRRSQQPLTPTALYKDLMLSSGAMSTRIEHLVRQGWLIRIASDDDRRSCKVTLTDAGLEKIDQILPLHIANMNAMLAGLNTAECTQLAMLLKKLSGAR